MRKAILLLPILTVFLTACPNSDEDDGTKDSGGKLPEEVNYFEIRMYDGGGMLPVSYETFISSDSAYWSYDRYGNETMIKWTPTEQEISLLYSDLRDLEFDQIKSNCEGEVYDRGGISIQVEVDDLSFEIDNSGNCFIKEEYAENYTRTINRINEYEQEKINEQLLTKRLIVSEGLYNSGYDIEIRLNEGLTLIEPSEDSLELQVEFYPGYNEFIVNLRFKDSTDYYGSPVSYKYEQIFETIDASTSKIVIDWQDESIVLEVE